MSKISTEMPRPAAPAPLDPLPGSGAATLQEQARELLVWYHQALGRVQALASALLDVTQADTPPMTAKEARDYRHAAGEALEAVQRGDLLVRDLWTAFGVERRVAPPNAPLPRGIKQERRRRPTKGTTA
jgi:hypothetical protein